MPRRAQFSNITQICNISYLGNLKFGEEKGVNIELQRYNEMNAIIKLPFETV